MADAAWELLSARPWSDVTVADICERADVAPRTFHRYFIDKAELLFSDAAEHEAALQASMGAHDFDIDRPKAWFLAVLADMARSVEAYGHEAIAHRAALIASAPELQSRDLLKRGRLEALVEGHLIPLVPATHRGACRVWIAVVMSCFFAAVREWSADGGALKTHVARALDAATTLVTQAHPSEEGRKAGSPVPSGPGGA